MTLAITAGEPAGIGPDLIVQIAQQGLPPKSVIIGNINLLRQRADFLKLPLTIHPYSKNEYPINQSEHLTVLNVPLAEKVTMGETNPANVPYVLDTIKIATQGCLSNQFSAMITAPVHKGVINQSGIPFTGHTEYIAALTKTQNPVMMLANSQLRIALVTTHLPLRDVADTITKESITNCLQTLHRDLKKKFGIEDPRIFVCGLNPHAGENGYLGREEIDIVIPAMRTLQQKGMSLFGPFPADTVFFPENLNRADAFLAMYHDQGLPVLKFSSFGESVNITLGIPIIRTSVDHGTALHLAGSGKANPNSLLTAINMAKIMMTKKAQQAENELQLQSDYS